MINESLKNAFKEMWKKNLNLLDISKSDLNSHIESYNPHNITASKIDAASSVHTHPYAGSLSAGGSAISAVKLDSSAGSATNPIYFSEGKPAACTYTLGKSVPSDAKFTDTVYTHPTTSGNKHIPSGGSSGQILRWSADGTAVWGADNNTIYSNATASTDGLMSSSDKTKLDGIAAGATKITVDSALSSTSTNPVQNKVIYGAISSKADLDTSGKVLSSQLPSYVDDVLEYSAKSNFPSTGESGKIYVDTATNLTYRWSGSAYVEISQSLALGETSSTAYRGDRGKIAYDHSQTSHAPTNAEVNQNAFSNVKVGSTTVSADSKTDTLELVAGTNVTLTPDATNDKVTITTNDTKVTQTAITASGYTNWRPLVIGASNNSTEGFSPTTVTDTTFTVNTISCQPSSGTIKATTFKGNASTATKLATAKTIALGTGATGTATNFDGSNNITIPVTSVKEAYLSWGGKNFSGAYGPIDAAMVPDLGANRLAFMPAAGVEVQYSRDGGSTWSTYSTSEADKINLFNGNGSGHIIGASTATGIDKSKYQLRITITTNTANVYTALNKFVIYCSTNGSSGSWCTIDAKTKANVDSGTDTWVTFANKVSLSGWSGYNVINTSDITTYGNRSDQHQKLRFTFGVTSHPSSSSYSGLIIYKIMGFGGVGWTIPSTMAATGRMYTYDASQNVTFPAAVSATALYSNGTEVSVKGHTHSASNITAGTLGGKVVANTSAVSAMPDKQLRNITISTADPTSSDGGDGDVWIKYGSTQSNCPFPVGGVYISIASTDPSSIWAGTAWEQFASGRTLVGINTNDADFNTIGQKGGKKTHTLTPNEIPAHGHGMAHTHSYTGPNTGSWKVGTNGKQHTWCTSAGGKTSGGASKTTTDNAGGDLAHNNLQPYIVVYMWKRVS